MIIKSMSRKEPSFNQLIDYMDSGRADSRFSIYHNLYSRDAEDVKNEFIQNARYLRRRAGGNYMYHEVISITRSEQIKLDEQKEKLRQIVHHYIQDRAQNNLAFAALHDDHDNNIHFHVIISSNEVSSTKRHRLSKSKFDVIKKSLEKNVLEQYPELEQKELINKKSSEKLSNKGAELKRRTGKTPQREVVREKVRQIFNQSDSTEALLKGFDEAGLDFYIRGKNPGLKDRATGRKHRLSTLGFIDEFEKINQKITDKIKNKKTTEKESQEHNKQKTKTKETFKQRDKKVDNTTETKQKSDNTTKGKSNVDDTEKIKQYENLSREEQIVRDRKAEMNKIREQSKLSYGNEHKRK
ncbi:MAG: hypothetical protein HQL46_02540 [Gammaproteobacteria bacterium]|nr:hypothetical protein [Gammaproteobacteria bacterium]